MATKVHEWVAHPSAVTCVALGRRSRQVLASGGGWPRPTDFIKTHTLRCVFFKGPTRRQNKEIRRVEAFTRSTQARTDARTSGGCGRAAKVPPTRALGVHSEICAL